MMGCTRKAPLLPEIADGLGGTDLRYFNIRETAGCSADAFPSSNGRPRPRTRTTDDYVREREIT
jgi:hypothetical protein